jgi:hypothetical protein
VSSSDDENVSVGQSLTVEDAADSGAKCRSRDEVWRVKTMLSKKVRMIG